MLEAIETIISDLESSIYIGNFPDDSVNNICTLYNTSGRPSEHFFNSEPPIRQPSIQVRIRDISYASAYTRMNDIIDLLDGESDIDTDSNYTIISMMLENDIMDLGKDKKNRTELTANFRLRIKKIVE